MNIPFLTLLVMFAANVGVSSELADRIEATTSFCFAYLEDPFRSSALVLTHSIPPTKVDEWKNLILQGLEISEKEPTFSGVTGYLVCNSRSDAFAVSVIDDSGIVQVHEVEVSEYKYVIKKSRPIKRGRKYLCNMDLRAKLKMILAPSE